MPTSIVPLALTHIAIRLSSSFTQSAHGGDWVAIEKDLLPLIREGLETAWRMAYLKGSQEMVDYRLTAMNTGWEVTGPLDVEMQIADLQLEAVLKPIRCGERPCHYPSFETQISLIIAERPWLGMLVPKGYPIIAP